METDYFMVEMKRNCVDCAHSHLQRMLGFCLFFACKLSRVEGPEQPLLWTITSTS
jgi:hypothetical protein